MKWAALKTCSALAMRTRKDFDTLSLAFDEV
jgi:hypothetical protein